MQPDRGGAKAPPRPCSRPDFLSSAQAGLATALLAHDVIHRGGIPVGQPQGPGCPVSFSRTQMPEGDDVDAVGTREAGLTTGDDAEGGEHRLLGFRQP